MAGVVKKAPELGMTSELGPEWPEYKPDKKFLDLVPSGPEEEVLVADIEKDLAEDDLEAEDSEEELN